MLPIAGGIVWILLGCVIGLIAGKVTATTDHNRVMANVGVGIVAAIGTGAVVTLVSGGGRSTATFWLAIVCAAAAAIIAVSLYRLFGHGGRASTVR